jgi:hypothetical protein
MPTALKAKGEQEKERGGKVQYREGWGVKWLSR